MRERACEQTSRKPKQFLSMYRCFVLRLPFTESHKRRGPHPSVLPFPPKFSAHHSDSFPYVSTPWPAAGVPLWICSQSIPIPRWRFPLYFQVQRWGRNENTCPLTPVEDPHT